MRNATRHVRGRALACYVVSLMVPLAAFSADVESTYRSRRDSARSEYEKRLYTLARTALQNGLGNEAMLYLREIVVRDPNHAKAAELAEKLEAYLAKHRSVQLTASEQRVMDQRRASMNALAERERKRYVQKLAPIARYCQRENYDQGLRETLEEGLTLFPDDKALRSIRGEKKHDTLGWLPADTVDRINAGKWQVDGEWVPWGDLAATRAARLKEREGKLLGPGFRYTSTYHYTIASNLKDPEFESVVLGGLETLVQEHYIRFYSDFTVGLRPQNVIYFEKHAEFAAYMKRKMPRYETCMGVYSPKKRTLYVWRRDRRGNPNGVGTAFHEATHGTLHKFFKDAKLPNWLNEGMAGFHEKTRPKKKGFCFGAINIPRMDRLIKLVKEGRRLKLDDVFSLDGNWNRDRWFSINLSAMFIHFLYDRQLLKPFLKEMVTHSDPDKAVLAVLGPNRGAWDKVFDNYLREELLNPEAYQKMRKQMEGRTVD